MARISTFNIGTYAFNAQVVELQSQSSRSRYVNWYLNGSYISGTSSIGTNTTVSTTKTFSGLSAGTNYSIEAKIYWSDTGGYITSLYSSITTNAPADSIAPTIDTPTTNIPQTGFTNQIVFNISAYARDNSGGSGLSKAELYIDNVYHSTKTLSSTSNNSVLVAFYSVTIPKTPKKYRLSLKVYDKNNNSSTSYIDQYIYYDNVSPVIGDISISQNVSSGIDVLGYATDNLGINSIVYQISKPNTNTYVNTSNARVEKQSGENHTFTKDADGNDFVSGNIYYVKFTALDKAGNFSSSKEVFLTYSNSRPSDFNWTTSERNAFENKGNLSVLTWQRWNEFIDNVKAMASWKHNSTNDIYNVLNAKMTKDDKVLTAARFNIVKNSIGSMNATGISDVKKGDVVKGEYFITLSSKLGGVTKSTGLGTLNQIHNLDLLYCIGRLEDGIRCK